MYGFCRLGFSPAPSAGAGCVSNGLETNDEQKAKNVADAAEHRHDPGEQRRGRPAGEQRRAAAANPVRTSSHRSSEPSWPLQNAESV